MKLRRVWEWVVTYPEDHILAELGGGYPTTNEQNARSEFESWRRVALLRRRVWRIEWRWNTMNIKDWDFEKNDWKPKGWKEES